MIELNIEYFFIGFLFTLLLTRYAYLKYIGFSPLGYRITYASRSKVQLTDADAELVNLIAFAELCSACLTGDAYRGVLDNELGTDVDREALNTLVSLGVPQHHAQFVCNYFLAQNLQYPGELIVLSSQTPLYIYSYSHDYYLPSQNRIRLQISELWKQKYHEMIEDKETIYFYK